MMPSEGATLLNDHTAPLAIASVALSSRVVRRPPSIYGRFLSCPRGRSMTAEPNLGERKIQQQGA
jgi:hypothetical protein